MRRCAAAGGAALAVAAGPAFAHGGLPGGTGFLAGLLHPLVAVEHLVLLLAIGLLSAQRPRATRGVGFAAVGVGLLAGVLVPVATGAALPGVASAILALAMLSGCLAALAATRQPFWILPVIAGLSGLAVGLDTDAVGATAAGAAVPVTQVTGVVTGVSLIVLDAAALAAATIRAGVPIAPRVAGSWIAAIALMLFALSLLPPRMAG